MINENQYSSHPSRSSATLRAHRQTHDAVDAADATDDDDGSNIRYCDYIRTTPTRSPSPSLLVSQFTSATSYSPQPHHRTHPLTHYSPSSQFLAAFPSSRRRREQRSARAPPTDLPSVIFDRIFCMPSMAMTHTHTFISTPIAFSYTNTHNLKPIYIYTKVHLASSNKANRPPPRT